MGKITIKTKIKCRFYHTYPLRRAACFFIGAPPHIPHLIFSRNGFVCAPLLSFLINLLMNPLCSPIFISFFLHKDNHQKEFTSLFFNFFLGTRVQRAIHGGRPYLVPSLGGPRGGTGGFFFFAGFGLRPDRGGTQSSWRVCFLNKTVVEGCCPLVSSAITLRLIKYFTRDTPPRGESSVLLLNIYVSIRQGGAQGSLFSRV